MKKRASPGVRFSIIQSAVVVWWSNMIYGVGKTSHEVSNGEGVFGVFGSQISGFRGDKKM